MKDPGNKRSVLNLLLPLCDISDELALTVSRKITILYISSTSKQNLVLPQ